jgi:hypothetical protein
MKKIISVLTTAVFMMASASAQSDPIVTDSTSRSTSDSTSNSTTKVISPPPSAISPAVTVINSDVCVVGYSGAAQTQVLGISFGGASRDENCERLKIARSLYDMGMKVAAVSALCQDRRVYDAMIMAGTPCPIDGKIGASAKEAWDSEPKRQPK